MFSRERGDELYHHSISVGNIDGCNGYDVNVVVYVSDCPGFLEISFMIASLTFFRCSLIIVVHAPEIFGA